MRYHHHNKRTLNMQEYNRRDFLRYSALAGGVAVLAPFSISSAQETAPKSGTPVDMAIARWKGEPASAPEQIAAMAEKLTQEAIAGLGGIGRFVAKGDIVWIKPNIGWNRKPEQAATTNPDVVAALVKLCYDAGAKKVKIGDSPCNQIELCYTNSGIEAAAKATDAEMVILDPNRFASMEIKGERLKAWDVYPELVECDLVINVPIAKHHNIESSKVTLCMKSYMGVVGGSRGTWHADLPTCLADITAFMKPRLSVLDAVRILTGNGPTGGSLTDVKRMDTVAAGADVVALDAFGGELLGHDPQSLPTVRAGYERGLGQIDYRKLNLKELAVA